MFSIIAVDGFKIIMYNINCGGDIMKFIPEIGFPQTGETVYPGMYACMNCPHDKNDDKAIVLLHKREKLPECPEC